MNQTKIGAGFIYSYQRIYKDRTPLLLIHGIGGHHLNFSHFDSHYRSTITVNKFQPYYCDLPGYGYSGTENMNFHSIQHFIKESTKYLFNTHRRKPILSISSASIWIINFEMLDIIDSKMIFDNPLIIDTVNFNSATVQIDLRKDLLYNYLPNSAIQQIEKDQLGKGLMPRSLYKEILRQSIKTTFDEFNIIAFYCRDDYLKSLHYKNDRFSKRIVPSKDHSVYTKRDSLHISVELNARI